MGDHFLYVHRVSASDADAWETMCVYVVHE